MSSTPNSRASDLSHASRVAYIQVLSGVVFWTTIIVDFVFDLDPGVPKKVGGRMEDSFSAVDLAYVIEASQSTGANMMSAVYFYLECPGLSIC